MIDKLANDIARAAEIKLAASIMPEFLNPITFRTSAAVAGDIMKSMSNTVSKYLGKQEADKYLKGLDLNDWATTNNILGAVVDKLMGNKSSLSSSTLMSVFADKFPKLQGLGDAIGHAHDLENKIRILNKYAPQILDTMNAPVPSLFSKATRGGAIGAGVGAGIGGAVGLYKTLKNRRNYNQSLKLLNGSTNKGPAPTILGDLKTIGKNMAGYGTAGGALGALGGIARRGNGITYSAGDKDLMGIVQNLSTIYDKTDARLGLDHHYYGL